MLGNYTNRWGRDPVVVLGMLTHMLSFLLIFYNLPDEAIHGRVNYAYGQLFRPSRQVQIHTGNSLFTSRFLMCWLLNRNNFVLSYALNCSRNDQIDVVNEQLALLVYVGYSDLYILIYIYIQTKNCWVGLLKVHLTSPEPCSKSHAYILQCMKPYQLKDSLMSHKNMCALLHLAFTLGTNSRKYVLFCTLHSLLVYTNSRNC